MSTAIQWTDETWNPVTGCSRVSEGCRHCYIERTPPFRMHGRKLGDPVQLHPERLAQPLGWKKPRRIFVNSLSDLFHEDVPLDFTKEVINTIEECWQLERGHTFQVLTKRPKRMKALMEGIYRELQIEEPLRNLWLGVSVEDQKTADERIPILLQTPAAVRFVSAEPLLGPIDFSISPNGQILDSCDECGHRRPNSQCDACIDAPPAIDWVIAGGESGPGARPCDIAWFRSIVGECAAAGVPVFAKQLGSYVVDRNDAGFEGDEPTSWPMDTNVDDPANEWNYQGAKIRISLKDRKGGDPAEWPADLRVREWPR